MSDPSTDLHIAANFVEDAGEISGDVWFPDLSLRVRALADRIDAMTAVTSAAESWLDAGEGLNVDLAALAQAQSDLLRAVRAYRALTPKAETTT